MTKLTIIFLTIAVILFTNPAFSEESEAFEMLNYNPQENVLEDKYCLVLKEEEMVMNQFFRVSDVYDDNGPVHQPEFQEMPIIDIPCGSNTREEKLSI